MTLRLRKRLFALTFGSGLVVCAAGFAQDGQDAPAQRFAVQEDTLVFDTTVPVDGEMFDIRYTDVDQMRDVLRAHDNVTTLALNSEGGGHYPSVEIAALVIDFALDTHITGICESSCVTVFLGGVNRTMAKGGRVGFHQLSWSASAVEDYYTKHRTRRDWATPFEFAEWMYADTQTETYTRVSYMIERGVDPLFALQTIRKPDGSMWHPYRAVLLAAGVLTQ